MWADSRDDLEKMGEEFEDFDSSEASSLVFPCTELRAFDEITSEEIEKRMECLDYAFLCNYVDKISKKDTEKLLNTRAYLMDTLSGVPDFWKHWLKDEIYSFYRQTARREATCKTNAENDPNVIGQRFDTNENSSINENSSTNEKNTNEPPEISENSHITVQRIVDLFNLALEKTFSLEIWDMFVAFLIRNIKFLGEDLVKFYCIKAVRCTKHDFARGARIFAKYCELEERISQGNAERLNGIKAMYLDQLKIPHKNLEDTFNSYSAFIGRHSYSYEETMKEASAIISKTRILSDAVYRFEEQFAHCSVPFVNSYINFLKRKKINPEFIFMVYERALKRYFNEDYFWSKYIVEVTHYMKSTFFTEPIVKRALSVRKNSTCIWEHYVHLNESLNNKKSVKEMFSKIEPYIKESWALSDCLRVIQEHYIRTMKRPDRGDTYVDENFDNCDISDNDTRGNCDTHDLSDTRDAHFINQKYQEHVNLLVSAFGMSEDVLGIVMHAIRFNTYISKDASKTRDLYEFAIKEFSERSDIWVGYAQFEIMNGNSSKALKILNNALCKKTSNPESILASMRLNAAENCPLDELYKELWIIQNELSRASARGDFSASERPETGVRPRKRFAEDISHRELHNDPQRESENTDHTPHKAQNVSHSYYEIDNKNAGCMVYVTNLSLFASEKILEEVFSKCGRIIDIIVQENEVTKEIEAFVEFSNATEARNALHVTQVSGTPVFVQRCKPKKSLWDYPMTLEPRKIFVKNLPQTFKKKDLRKMFGKYGKIADISLIARSKTSFAYLEFLDSKSANESLEMDEAQLSPGGVKISVLISDPRKSKQNINEREIFVNNLPLSVLEEDIKDLFKEFGEFDVRLPKDTRGNARGFAFLTFKCKNNAANSLSLNSKMYQGRIINVTIADHMRKSYKRDKKIQSRNKNAKLTGVPPVEGGVPVKGGILAAPRSVLKSTIAAQKPAQMDTSP